MDSEDAPTLLPSAGQLWESGPPYHLTIRVLRLELAQTPPIVEYEVLDDDGSRLSGPLSSIFDASWSASFHQRAAAAK